MKTPIVLYKGPSMLDGAPIVCIATLGSTNVKTGPMVQTWIMRADVNPLQASADKADASVCGQCPRRHSLGGDCYVTLIQAPRAVWLNWHEAGEPGVNWIEPKTRAKLALAAQTHGFRMGSYGDPMAVPFEYWAEALGVLGVTKWTGYTHQWRRTWDHNTRAWFSDHVMASADSLADADLAKERGWRYFLAIGPDVTPPKGSILCLAEREGDKARTCETCGICNGRQGRDGRTSVHLVEHGARATAKHKRSLGVLT